MESARARDVGDLQEDRAGLRRRGVRRGGRRPRALGGDRPLLQPLPCGEVARRIDGAVITEAEHSDGMDLEVEVVRRAFGVARVPREADDIAGVDVRAVFGERRERGEMRVVELVPLLVADPEPVAADRVPADAEYGSARARK